MTAGRSVSAMVPAALAVATLVLAACGQGRDTGDSRPPGDVRFSILSEDPAKDRAAIWAPFLADMGTRTGLEVSPITSSNGAALVEAMRERRTDVGWFSSASGLEAVRAAGGEVFARTFDAGGRDGDASVLIVGARSRLTLADVLACRKTLTLGLGDGLSTDALAPETYLFAPRGLDPGACFRRVGRGQSRRNNLAAVAGRRLDVATDTARALNLDRQRGLPEACAVRVIWTSPDLPGDPIVWRRNLDPAIKEMVRQFFLTYGQADTAEGARQRAYLARLDIGGFRPADDNFLLPVREMEAAHSWLLAKRGDDPARIAVARRNLDEITAARVAFEARTRAPAAAQ